MHRARIMRIPLPCVFLAMAVLLVFPAGAEEKDEARYLRIGVAAEQSFYVEVRGNSLRVAATADELKNAKAVQAVETIPSKSQRTTLFPELELPLPEGAFPTSIKKVTMALTMRTTTIRYLHRATGQHKERTVTRADITCTAIAEDDKNMPWQHEWRMSSRLGKTANRAKLLLLPDFAKTSLDVELSQLRAGGLGMGVALRLKRGKAELGKLSRNGTEPMVMLKIQNEDGDVIASETKPLSAFGFG